MGEPVLMGDAVLNDFRLVDDRLFVSFNFRPPARIIVKIMRSPTKSRGRKQSSGRRPQDKGQQVRTIGSI